MKKILFFVLLIMIVVGGLMYKFFGDISGVQVNLNTPKDAKILQTFIQAHDEEYVVLSLTLTPKMAKAFAEGLKKSPEVLLLVPDVEHNTSTNYVIKQEEGGKRQFVFDEARGKLEGLFHNYKRTTVAGETFIYLLPTNPTKLKRQDNK